MLSKGCCTKRPFHVLRVAAFVAVLMAGGWIEEASAKDEQFFEFMKSVGCSRLPMTACEFLDPDNARSIALAYRGLLTNRICGTINPGAAAQLSAAGATSPECDALVKYLNEDMQRWNGGATKLPDQTHTAPPGPAHPSDTHYGGVSVAVEPREEASSDLDGSVRTKVLQLNGQ